MDAISLKVHLKSTGLGMLHHNSRLANPMDKFAKELKRFTSKRKKTDDDYIQMAEIEFLGGLWLNEKQEPCVPTRALMATIREGLKQRKLGMAGLRAMHFPADAELIYNGPRKPDALWKDERFRLQTMESTPGGKVLRTRPYFRQWELKFSMMFYPDLLDQADLEQGIQVAGDIAGFGDRRPTHGRYEVVSIKAA